jgi:hypothetical protein
MVSLAVYGAEFPVAGWIWPASVALGAPLGATALLIYRAAGVRSSVPGDAGDVFDDLPLELPRNPWLLLALTTAAAAGAALVAGGVTNEGPRNAVFELVLATAGFLAPGKRLGLRR